MQAEVFFSRGFHHFENHVEIFGMGESSPVGELIHSSRTAAAIR
jgi:hypothetical protein